MVNFSAREFLNAAPEIHTTLSLPQQLRADPKRLRREFLTIATDTNERFDFRTRALMVLSRHAKELDAYGSSEVTGELLTAFEREFPKAKLNSITEAMRGEDCTPEGFIAHLFCIAFATLSPENTHEPINAVREALKGTSLDAILTKHLSNIRREGTS